ncbi:MAG: hypothetical protein IPL05_04735 [Betaproteobacteria bacterium]|nr:hypothetical protein [Betaproteobacteria bacterium]
MQLLTDENAKIPLLLSTRRIRQNRTRLQKCTKINQKSSLAELFPSLIFALYSEFAIPASKQELSSPPFCAKRLSRLNNGRLLAVETTSVDGSQSLPFSVRLMKPLLALA